MTKLPMNVSSSSDKPVQVDPASSRKSLKDGVHFVFGAGLARALVANLGVLKAARAQAVPIASIGGISAGAIMSLLYAGGIAMADLEELVMKHNLSDFISRNRRWFHSLQLLWRVLNYRRCVRGLPSRGLYNAQFLGDFVDNLFHCWPENYWTMAYSPRDDAQVVFTSKGVFMRYRGGRVELLDSGPAPLGLAIRATCAVPGFFDSVEYTASSGRTIELVDGFLSWDGYCPAAFVEEFFVVDKLAIVACDVNRYKNPNRLLGKGYLAVLTPDPPFPAYRFFPSVTQKRSGVVEACQLAGAAFAAMN